MAEEVTVTEWLLTDWLPWAWLILAIILTIAEIFTAGFFLISFGIGAGAAALFAYLGFGYLAQLGVFIAASAAVLMLLRPLALRVSGHQPNTVGIDRVLGRQAIVLETIDPRRGRGVVRVGSERWSAEAADGAVIQTGALVEVVGVDGAHLRVRALAAG
jgi:membrane protein implicated in regulation of membrane protease activity